MSRRRAGLGNGTLPRNEWRIAFADRRSAARPNPVLCAGAQVRRGRLRPPRLVRLRADAAAALTQRRVRPRAYSNLGMGRTVTRTPIRIFCIENYQ